MVGDCSSRVGRSGESFEMRDCAWCVWDDVAILDVNKYTLVTSQLVMLASFCSLFSILQKVRVSFRKQYQSNSKIVVTLYAKSRLTL